MQAKEKFKTYKNVFDNSTLRVLFKLESEGYFEELKSPVSIGKESNVFSAVTRDGDYIIAKIYRVNTADFKRMYKYISADPRFKGLSNHRRKVIFAWAQREYRNLLVASEAGADVPTPYAVKDNVLLIQMIGEGNSPAPRLKDAAPKNPKRFAKLLFDNLKLFYSKGFIHGDLSEYNILNFREKPYIIDLSHGVRIGYPNADELLERDIRNLNKFFGKLNVDINTKKFFSEVKSHGI